MKLHKSLQVKYANSVNNASEGDRAPLPPKRHQIFELHVYSEGAHDLLDARAIPSFVSDKFPNKLVLGLSPRKMGSIIGEKNSVNCEGLISGIPLWSVT